MLALQGSPVPLGLLARQGLRELQEAREAPVALVFLVSQELLVSLGLLAPLVLRELESPE